MQLLSISVRTLLALFFVINFSYCSYYYRQEQQQLTADYLAHLYYITILYGIN